jgi:hypothetical protein
MTKQTNEPRICVQAVCAIKGSSLENEICRLWYGRSVASCQKAMKRLQEVHGAYYRDWQIVNLTGAAQ